MLPEPLRQPVLQPVQRLCSARGVWQRDPAALAEIAAHRLVAAAEAPPRSASPPSPAPAAPPSPPPRPVPASPLPAATSTAARNPIRPRSSNPPSSEGPGPPVATGPLSHVARQRSGGGRHGSWRRAWPGCCGTRPGQPGKTPLAKAVVDRVVEWTLGEPRGEVTHWTGRAMAEAAAISLRSVQRIWAAHGLQPHRIRALQAVQGPRVRGQAPGYRRPVRRSAGPCRGAVGGREEPCVDGPRLAREKLTSGTMDCLRSCVRPIDAVA